MAGCKKANLIFQKYVHKMLLVKPYFQRVTLVDRRNTTHLSLIPLLLVNKGIRGNEKGVAGATKGTLKK